MLTTTNSTTKTNAYYRKKTTAMAMAILIRMVTGLMKTVMDVKRYVNNVMLDFGSTRNINAKKYPKTVSKSTQTMGDVLNVSMGAFWKKVNVKRIESNIIDLTNILSLLVRQHWS